MMLTNKNWERFTNKIQKTDTCWNWTGAKNSKGYGCIAINKQHWLAHRLSYTIHKGEIPTGHIICHTCDNPQCVNPNHLFAGTNSDNMQDMITKNRHGKTSRPQTHCRKGHEFTPQNTHTRTTPDGKTHKNCRTCRNNWKTNQRHNPQTRQKVLEYNRNYQKTYYHNKKQQTQH